MPGMGPGYAQMPMVGHHGAVGMMDPQMASMMGMGGMPGMGGAPLGPRFVTGRSQVRFVRPQGMKVAWQSGEAGGQFTPPQLEAPARYNFAQARIYRLKLTDIQNRPSLELYPTLEVYPGNAKVDAYLAHNAIPIEFVDEDFDQVQAGNFVTKVIYLPDAKYQELAIAGVETLVSTRLDPGVDPVKEANRKGTILAVLRVGSVDLEMMHSPDLFGGPGPAGMPAMGVPGPSAPAELIPAPTIPAVVQPPVIMAPSNGGVKPADVVPMATTPDAKVIKIDAPKTPMPVSPPAKVATPTEPFKLPPAK
jgi:hypothetical protein